ncbi:MAG TPA: helix-turn-helix domain-containing protein [Thermoanaerobaculia bacterium]|jgi:AcrR family transcriptional regulator
MSTTLTEQRTDLTQRLIIDAALQTLQEDSVGGLTMRAVAKRARLSERTIFRYFATRDEFLDAVAAEISSQMHVPHPRTMEELLAMPRTLFSSLEARRDLIRASLHTDVSERIMQTNGRQRWAAIRKIVDAYAPRAPEAQRKIAATNIRYFLSAATWSYYRFVFRFTLEETIECVETAIRQSLDALR